MKVGNQRRKVAFEEERTCFNDLNFISILSVTPPYLYNTRQLEFPSKI